MNAIDQQRSINNDGLTSLDTSLTKLKDLDYAEAISRLNAQTTGLQAAQQAYVKVQGLSLFNFL
jgi:flagellar hook-associated protein 3 FlgL